MADKDKKLRTSQDVYHRIRWDAAFDASQYIIGYETRDNGMSEIALDAFDPNGDIPWHRIWYIRNQTSIQWDRKNKIDLIFGSGENESPLVLLPKKTKAIQVAEAEAKETNTTVREVYHFHKNSWRLFNSELRSQEPHRPSDVRRLVNTVMTDPETPSELRIESGENTKLILVTYNLLSGPNEAENMGLALRMKGLSQLLESSEANLIAVQELSPEWRSHLLSQKAMQQYETTVFAEDLLTVGLFSKHPIKRAVEYRYNQGKQFLLCEVETPKGIVVVVVVHLTSDAQVKSQEKRAAQWQWIQNEMIRPNEAIQNGARLLMMGDFNASEAEVANWQPSFEGIDLWRELFPMEEGLTFDASKNDLARLTSISGKQARLDRILARGFRVEQMKLIGREPVGRERGVNIFPSDHFGLMGEVTMKENESNDPKQVDWSKEAPTYRSSLLVVPPARLWDKMQEVRKQYDPSFERWMPHINMVYGFVSESVFAAAAERLQEALKDEQPFEVKLTRVQAFGHSGSTTIFLAPEEQSKARLTALQAKVEALFPMCDEQGKKSPKGFTPHMTIAKLKKNSSSAAPALQTEWQEKLLPISFTLDGLYLISRREEQPFEVRYVVPFGGSKKTLSEKHNAALRLLKDCCEAVLLKYNPLYVTGSAQFGTASEKSDLDLLCLGKKELSHQEFFAEVRELVEQSEDVSEVRLVEEATVPVLKAKVNGVSVDLTYARVKEERSPQRAVALDDISKIALAGYIEIDALLQSARRRFAEEDYKRLLGWVTQWARARQIYGNRLGYLGGFSWAVLVAVYLQRAPLGVPFEKLVQGFLQMYAEWQWPTPVCFTDEIRGRYTPNEREPMPILTPISPARNSARNVCRSTLSVMQQELARAASMVKRESLESAAKPIEFDSMQRHVTLSLEGDEGELEGFVESRLTGLYVQLEQALQSTVRPFFAEHSQRQTTWKIQLREAASEEILTNCMQRFVGNIQSQKPEVKLSYQTLYAL